MCATFADDDVGKSVVNAAGEEVGLVTAVEHGTAHVEPDPGITDTIKATLGWEGTNEDTYPLQEHAVDRVTDDEIRLEGDLSGSGPSSREAETSGMEAQGRDTDAGGHGGERSTSDETGLTDDRDRADDRRDDPGRH